MAELDSGNKERIVTGVEGLDPILGGGLLRNNLYLVKGPAGAGKTTLALQFLLEGARRGEKCLYLGLSETRGQLGVIARSFGWSLDGVNIYEMRRRGEEQGERANYTVFSPSEFELEQIARELLEQVDRVRPDRLVIDSLSEIRLLTGDPYRYRRELLALSDHITACVGAGLLIDVEGTDPASQVAETLVAGVIQLEQLAPAYGGERRRLRVRKLRASRSIGGYHDFSIHNHGVEVHPRLVAATHRAAHSSAEVSSGIAELDTLLGGGIDRGTSTVLMGPAGSGKSTVALQFVTAAAERGEASVIFCFDESPTNLLVRARGLGIPIEGHVQSGRVRIDAIDPAELSPGELAHRAQKEVDRGVRVVVIDSLNGFLTAMLDDRFLGAHLHELLAYLSEKGVATILTIAQRGFISVDEAPVNVTYIADTVMLFRYFEAMGAVRQAISVVKKRTGAHERTIRELTLGPTGVRIGPPITEFQGVLTGDPVFVGSVEAGGEIVPAR